MSNDSLVLIRGGGDLASGVALRLHRVGIRVLIAELAQPLAVRRTVSFSEAVYEGEHTIEGVKSKLIDLDQVPAWNEAEIIPVLIDPEASILLSSDIPAVVDARLLKHAPEPLPRSVPLYLGLGPGFCAGENCDAVIETRRGHTLGRAYWSGSAQADTREPEGDPRRVLRAPHDGDITGLVKIGDHVEDNQPIAEIHGNPGNLHATIHSPFAGVVRGLMRDGSHVMQGLKIGDVDARNDPRACFLVSDKSLAIGGGVLEAILTRTEIREKVLPQRKPR
jgi:xanthine dehydrogenase accessory factor